MKLIKAEGQSGLFLCPVCKKTFWKDKYNGERQKTCGSKECTPSRSFRHGYVGTSIYNSWAGMKQRCDNPNASSYKHYGEKGITYPETWETFKGFLEDMIIGWHDGLTIDRIDVKSDYSKENCQWISHIENVIKDEIKTIAKYGIDDELIAAYASAADAVRAGEAKNSTSITRVARGERKHYKGYVWKYL